MFSRLRGLFCKKHDALKGIKLTPIRHYANGQHSHAEGYYCTANEPYSHSEGYCNDANGIASHTEGILTVNG